MIPAGFSSSPTRVLALNPAPRDPAGVFHLGLPRFLSPAPCLMRLESGGVSGAGEPGVGGSGNMASGSGGVSCRSTQIPYPPTPTPKHPLSFSRIKDFRCTLGINLSLSRPRAGFGRTQFHHKGSLPLCRHPPTTLFFPFLALPKGLNRKWAKVGVGTSRPLLPRETARLQAG